MRKQITHSHAAADGWIVNNNIFSDKRYYWLCPDYGSLPPGSSEMSHVDSDTSCPVTSDQHQSTILDYQPAQAALNCTELNFAGIEPPPALLQLRNRSYSCVYTNLKYKYLIWVSSPRVDLWISDCPFLIAAYCELYFMRVNHVENPLKYCGLIKSPHIVSDLSSKSTFLELTPYWKYYWG